MILVSFNLNNIEIIMEIIICINYLLGIKMINVTKIISLFLNLLFGMLKDFIGV